VVTGTGKSLAMDAPGEKGQLVRASGAVDLSIGGFVELGGSLAFERARQVVTLTDGTQVQTEMITIGGTDLDGFVGIGPYGDDADGDGVFEKSEINPDARGFGVRDVEFGVALFRGQGAYADSRWVTATGVVGGVDVMLGLPESLRFDIHSLGLSANLVSHEAPVLSGPAVSLPPALKLDATTGVIDFATGSFAGSTPDEAVTLALCRHAHPRRLGSAAVARCDRHAHSDRKLCAHRQLRGGRCDSDRGHCGIGCRRRRRGRWRASGVRIHRDRRGSVRARR
jgi:hypothetical protein